MSAVRDISATRPVFAAAPSNDDNDDDGSSEVVEAGNFAVDAEAMLDSRRIATHLVGSAVSTSRRVRDARRLPNGDVCDTHSIVAKVNRAHNKNLVNSTFLVRSDNAFYF